MAAEHLIPRRRMALLAVAAAFAALLLAAPATQAAPPRSFYGVVPQTPLTTADLDRMGQGQVGTVRVLINWSTIDPTSAPDYDWSTFDPIVADAARNGVEVLPFLYGTPVWVAQGLDGRKCALTCGIFAPKSQAALDAWTAFVAEAVARYGPGGAFWAENPSLPVLPIDAWQIWNEQNSKTFFKPKPNARAYTKLLAAAYSTIKARDPNADVILGGMAGLEGSRKATAGWDFLAKLYRAGAKASFDGVAPHPYGAKLKSVIEEVALFRTEMRQARDAGADMWVTEIGWGSARGGDPLNRGPRGQATRLREAFKYFGRKRGALNVQTVTWFSWMDSTAKICAWCPKSGLFGFGLTEKAAWRAFVKFTGGS